MNSITNWLTNSPIAHRGLHDGNRIVPENSMPAFAKAITHKHPIELDIQIIKDGTIIVFHDDTLQRVCNASKKTKNLTNTTLNNYTLFQTQERIPTLIEVLKKVKGQVPLLIELKTDGLFKKLEKALLHILAEYPGPIALQSFNHMSVKWLQNNSKYKIGQLAEASTLPVPLNKIEEYLQLNTSHTPDFIGYNIDLFPNKVVTHFKQKGVPILAWTVRNKHQIKEKSVYFDNIIFEGFTP